MIISRNIYILGERFTIGCESVCRCTGADMFGCVTMCPPQGKIIFHCKNKLKTAKYRYSEGNIHHGFLGQTKDYM